MSTPCQYVIQHVVMGKGVQEPLNIDCAVREWCTQATLTEQGCTGRLRVGREGFNGTLTGQWSPRDPCAASSEYRAGRWPSAHQAALYRSWGAVGRPQCANGASPTPAVLIGARSRCGRPVRWHARLRGDAAPKVPRDVRGGWGRFHQLQVCRRSAAQPAPERA